MMGDDSIFANFIETALPRNCWVVAIRHVYLDESGTDDTSQYLTVAAYLFESQQAARFSRDWTKVLNAYGLPYAHMTDAVSQNGVYSALTDAQCDKINRLLIENIKRRTLVGFTFSIDKARYEAMAEGLMGFPSAYGFCLVASVHAIARWCDQRSYGGKIAYFFEAGHADQSDGNRCMQMLESLDHRRDEYRYSSHSFFRKGDPPPLQAADMLAWQVNKHIKRQNAGLPMRKDFAALLRAGDFRADLSDENLDSYRQRWSDAIDRQLGDAG